MDMFADYPVFSTFVTVVLIFLLVKLVQRLNVAAARRTCTQCGTRHPKGAKFCRTCGEPLGTGTPKS